MIVPKYVTLFWDKVEMDDSGCWIFTGTINDAGYGIYSLSGERVRAHRYSYFLANGTLPDSVCHKCDNPPCVNPDHLFGGAHVDNMQDMYEKQRHAFGNRSGMAKLRAEDIVPMLNDYASGKYSFSSLGEKYGVAYSTIYDTVRRKNWKEVTEEYDFSQVDSARKCSKLRGMNHPNRKINEDVVREIRAMKEAGYFHKDIAEKFNIHVDTVKKVVYGKLWGHVK